MQKNFRYSYQISRLIFIQNTYHSNILIRKFNLYANENVSDLKRFLLEFDADAKEGRYWLKYFKNFSDLNKPFAITHLDDDIFQNERMLQDLSSSICFLHRNGMKCILIHGTCLMDKEHINLDKFKAVREKQIRNSLQLANSFETNRTPCRLLFSGSGILQATQNSNINNNNNNNTDNFQIQNENNQIITKISSNPKMAKKHSLDRIITNNSTLDNYGGKLLNVNYDLIEWCLKSDTIPIIGSLAETDTGQLLLLDPADILEKMSAIYRPLKILLINTTGGIYNNVNTDDNGISNIIPQVNLPCELQATLSIPGLDELTKKRVLLINKMLQNLLPQSSIVITSANQVLKELFTYRGSGTLFKHIDTFIQTNNIHDIDSYRLAQLINRTFEKSLKETFFQSLQNKIDLMIVSENYNAAAIITHEDDLSIPYLNKFVISADIQGQGLSDTLWDLLKSKYSSLIWRSAHTNKINPWYFKHCEGCWSNKNWIIFWYGITDHETCHKAIQRVMNIEISFKPPPPASKLSKILQKPFQNKSSQDPNSFNFNGISSAAQKSSEIVPEKNSAQPSATPVTSLPTKIKKQSTSTIISNNSNKIIFPAT